MKRKIVPIYLIVLAIIYSLFNISFSYAEVTDTSETEYSVEKSDDNDLRTDALVVSTPLAQVPTVKKYISKTLIQETWVGVDGNRIMNEDGYCYYKITLNAHTKPGQIDYYDTEDNLVNTKQGYATIKHKLNGSAKLIETVYNNKDGTQVNGPQGYAKLVNTYKGLRILSIEYFDANGNYTVPPGLFAKKEYEYNKENRLIRESYLDADGKPMLNADGAATILYERGSSNEILIERFLDATGNPTVSKQGYASLLQTFDKKTLLTAEYRDEDDEMMIGPKGYARIVIDYKNVTKGLVSKESYYGIDEKLMLIHDGYSVKEYLYDKISHLIEERYLDTGENLIEWREGYASVTYAYKNNNIVQIEYYGLDGSPIDNQYGYSEVAYAYDKRNNRTQEKYYDAAGAPVLCEKGYHEVDYQYDSKKVLIAESYLDIDGNPVIPIDKKAPTVRYKFDKKGLIIEEQYTDHESNPVLCDDGYAKVTREFDKSGRITKESYYDTDGNPILSVNGYASLTKEYDAAGNSISETYWDKDGYQINAVVGYARIERVYVDNRLVSETYLDPSGNPVALLDGYASFTQRYDSSGNLIDVAYYDENGILVPSVKALYARVSRIYNAQKRVTEERYYGYNGQPFIMPDGYAMLTRDYDIAGNVLVQSYRDADGALTNNTKLLYAEARKTYDKHNRFFELTIYRLYRNKHAFVHSRTGRSLIFVWHNRLLIV
ncbi:hypothetical protein AGMMS49992_21010 [Clostridia bacterium]|nr:hypothetical protein AGMMS49992_21010 [Clostridia bacterium]